MWELRHKFSVQTVSTSKRTVSTVARISVSLVTLDFTRFKLLRDAHPVLLATSVTVKPTQINPRLLNKTVARYVLKATTAQSALQNL